MTQRIIRVGSFNLYNLVLPGKPYYGRQDSRRDYQRKLDWSANLVDIMQADIMAFQEVFHPAALAELLDLTRKLKNSHFQVAGPTGDLPRVALASRFPIRNHHVYESFPSPLTIDGMALPIKTFSRPVLKATIELPNGVETDVFVVHLKSKRPDFLEGESRKNPLDLARGQARSLIRRAAESAAIREILLRELQDKPRPVILCGDVNDTGQAVTSRIMSGEPPHRRYPHEVKQEIWDVLLYHVKDIQARRSPQDMYFTHIHNGFHEALDHIMVSQEWVRENPQHIGEVGYVRLFNDHLVDETISEDDIPRWASDHGTVVATLELRKQA